MTYIRTPCNSWILDSNTEENAIQRSIEGQVQYKCSYYKYIIQPAQTVTFISTFSFCVLFVLVWMLLTSVYDAFPVRINLLVNTWPEEGNNIYVHEVLLSVYLGILHQLEYHLTGLSKVKLTLTLMWLETTESQCWTLAKTHGLEINPRHPQQLPWCHVLLLRRPLQNSNTI